MSNKFNLLSIMFFLLFFHIYFENIYAEDPILISFSPNIDKVIFDGKWTNPLEWKESSYNKFYFEDENAIIHLRTAHHENFIYVQINFESDKIINKGIDSAMICFDSQNDKTKIPQSDDYCFSTSLGVEKSFTFQGNNNSANKSFSLIQNDQNFIAIGTPSDHFDRYSKTPHASYEFRIPLDVLGRSDNYGFYLSVFDGNSQNSYTWPYEIKNNNSTLFSSPSEWGNLISPDKSLPEFNLSSLLYFLIPLILFFGIISKFNPFKNRIFSY